MSFLNTMIVTTVGMMMVMRTGATCWQDGFQAFFNPSGGVLQVEDLYDVFDIIEWGVNNDYPPISHGSTTVANAVYLSGPTSVTPLVSGTSAVAEYFNTTDMCKSDFQTCVNTVFLEVSVYSGDAFTVSVNGMTLSTASTYSNPVWVAVGSSSTLYMGATNTTSQVSPNGAIYLQPHVGDASGLPCVPTASNTGTCYQTFMVPFSNWKCPGSSLPLTNNVNNVAVTVFRFSGTPPTKNNFVCQNVLNWQITRPCVGSTHVVGDPQFVGFRGQSYQVHGIDGAFYNLISSAETQVNSRFDFLTRGTCPVIGGVPQTDCWSHPGSYLGAIGVQQISDAVVQQLQIYSGPADTGFGGVILNDQHIYVGANITLPNFQIRYVDSFAITVTTPQFTFYFSNSDMFINQAIRINVPISEIREVHGLIGQTHNPKIYPTSLKYIEGRVDDYLLEDESLFSTSFLFNRFEVPTEQNKFHVHNV